ncbi:DUF4190 domain-containing protein [Herbiconiux sp. L3-i23]|uniref:DUF4190 domain-containing protein n=1 Tax=Herbiconiux sp. L3-i23 TaxID=2905871 RepID=UPI00205F09F5|nr:DUF4190 domain-containing protein [Herbiconiux sp. L3-i23]BDI23830.1 hypothetical protein L3i23_26060 [Herbiconiux sp. L3-i23]
MSDQTPPPPPPEDPYAAPSSPAYSQQPYAQQPYSGTPAAPAKTPILSILSMIGGILGVVGGLGVFWIPVAGPILQLWFPAAAVVLGFLGKRKEPQAKGFWLTGIITGFVGLLLFLIGILITVFFFVTISSYDGSYNYEY